MTTPFIPTPDDTQAAQLQLDLLRAQTGRLPVRLAEVLGGLLVESGALPHRKVGPRRRLYLEDVLTYRAQLNAQRQAALQALADDLQDLGLD